MRFVKETLIRASQEKVFGFHLLPDAFERLVPPWEKVKIIQKADIRKIGSRAIIESKLFGFFKVKWIAEHTRYEPPRMFEDVQISGPFKKWRHQHIVEPHAQGSILKDIVEFEPPMSIIGKAVAPSLILTKMEKMFAHRHEVTRKWCEQGE